MATLRGGSRALTPATVSSPEDSSISTALGPRSCQLGTEGGSVLGIGID